MGKKMEILRLVVMGCVIFISNSMKHWNLLILPSLLRKKMHVSSHRQEIVLLIYLSYFYGNQFGH